MSACVFQGVSDVLQGQGLWDASSEQTSEAGRWDGQLIRLVLGACSQASPLVSHSVHVILVCFVVGAFSQEMILDGAREG